MLQIVSSWLGIIARGLFLAPTLRSLLLLAGVPLLALGLTWAFARKKLWLPPLLTAGFGLMVGVISLGKYALSNNEYSSQFFALVLPSMVLVSLVLTAAGYGVRAVRSK